MQKYFVFALMGAFFISFGQSRSIGKQDLDSDVNCVACKNCINCANYRGIGKRSTESVDYVPYQVSLQRVSAGKKAVHFCDGIIIRSKWILTSAHCFDSDKSVNFSIRYGTIFYDEKGMAVTAQRLILHPNYRQNASIPNDDVALIRTNISLEKDNDGLAWPIQVATGEVKQGIVTVAGWPGAIIDVSAPINQDESVRQFCKIQVPIVPPETSYHEYLLSNMFCVTDDSGNSSRAGYSSGAVVQNNQLVGVVCGGKECGRPGQKGFYTSMAKYFFWIHEQIELVEHKMKKAVCAGRCV